jgi:hypothetical protein
MSIPSYSRHDVVLIRYPFSDLSGGKVRPAIVVNAAHISQDLIITPLTSRTENLTQVDDPLRQWLGLTTIPSDQILELVQKVLTRHIRSEEEISSIIREIRNQGVGNQT